jgi:hypothetical protein
LSHSQGLRFVKTGSIYGASSYKMDSAPLKTGHAFVGFTSDLTWGIVLVTCTLKCFVFYIRH